jgi:hypothetical protein
MEECRQIQALTASLYPLETAPVPLNRRVGAIQSWSGRFGENIKSLARSGIRTRVVQTVGLSLYCIVITITIIIIKEVSPQNRP